MPPEFSKTPAAPSEPVRFRAEVPLVSVNPVTAELGDWKQLPGEPSDLVFAALERNSGESVEVRLLPWLKSEEAKSNLQRQIRLVELVAAKDARRTIRFESEANPARLVLEPAAVRLSSVVTQLSPSELLEAAANIWKTHSSAINAGLFIGCVDLRHVYLRNEKSPNLAVDFLARFYTSEGAALEPTIDTECSDLCRVIAEILDGLLDRPDSAGVIVGRERGLVKQLLRESTEGDTAGLYDKWAQFFESRKATASADDVAEQPHNTTPQAISVSSSDSTDATGEIEIRKPTGPIVTDESTGEIEIAKINQHESAPPLPKMGERLGRFRLDTELGRGGMGVVYQGVDLSTDEAVAIKVLRPSGSDVAQAVRRFRKEARLLAGIHNDYVTKLIEAGFERGFHYLAMEFVPGCNLRDWLRDAEAVKEEEALSLVADVARALVDAHQQGIVHRDIKPENILLGVEGEDAQSLLPLTDYRIKLSDFGIARSMEQSASMEVTKAGTLLGTPTFMSPEQCKGSDSVTPASDTYALGVTLYAILAGRPPFEAEEPMKLAAMHCFDPPVDVRRRNNQVSVATAALVGRMLSKSPERRPSDAMQIVHEIEGILHGRSSEFTLQPTSSTNAAPRLWERTFHWELESSPEALWPYVSDTERLNRAIGLQAVTYRTEKSDDGRMIRFGAVKLAGMNLEWEEHPFEWVESQRMGVLREFTGGPFRWYSSLVELAPNENGGTHLRHTIRVEPRNIAGRMIAAVEVGWKARRALGRVYQRINETLRHSKDNSLVDAFEPTAPIAISARKRADQRTLELIKLGVGAETAHLLKDFVLSAPPQSIAQIRPMELADHLQIPIEECLDACIVAASCGLLQIQWDILCPTCRAPASSTHLLADIDQHTGCEACDTEFASNVASAVELVFSVHPEIRKADTGQYCVGGPVHSRHVVTQLRLAPSECLDLAVPLAVGDYLLRISGRIQTQPLRARAQAAPSRYDHRLSQIGTNLQTAVVRSGPVTLALTNDSASPQTIRLERTIDRATVVTAAMASAMPRFRELFPDQVLQRDNAVATEELTLVAINVTSAQSLYTRYGDAEAYQILQDVLSSAEACISCQQGSVIKSTGESLLASFRDCESATLAALEIERGLRESVDTPGAKLTCAVHRGPLLVTTLNGRLDYFGSTSRDVLSLAEQRDEGVLITDAVFSDAAVQPHLQTAEDLVCNVESIALRSGTSRLVKHITLAAGATL